MANTYTSKNNFAKPALNDTGWNTTLNANLDQVDTVAAVGGLAVALTEVPSASLNVKVAAGTFRASTGTIVSYAGTSSQALTASNTNYVYLTDAGTLTVSTSAFPGTAHVRLATVVVGGSTVTSITDSRLPFVSAGVNNNTVYLALAGGTFADSGGVVTVGCGTTNGTKIGTSSTDKIGFWGATPVVRPASANQAALGSLVTATLTNSTTGSATTTIGDVGASFSQSGLNNIHASLLVQINNAVTDFASVKTLVNQLRSDLVTAGVLKGSA